MHNKNIREEIIGLERPLLICSIFCISVNGRCGIKSIDAAILRCGPKEQSW